ncbi:(2Fe-2S)-binding protein [Agilicoccus flavus]|uniref:(2Fe-2S)-binding protein n=1 Tax=Agilicoccus flavus TaxID=2775968 RepID=UPI001CF6FB1D|nr:(2Fe-2S)-binding protein [Agilicoccus flavus]
MIVCHCRVVRDSDVGRAIASGARTLAAVCGRTGAGQTCGGCVLGVRRCMEGYAEAPSPATSEDQDEAA